VKTRPAVSPERRIFVCARDISVRHGIRAHVEGRRGTAEANRPGRQGVRGRRPEHRQTSGPRRRSRAVRQVVRLFSIRYDLWPSRRYSARVLYVSRRKHTFHVF